MYNFRITYNETEIENYSEEKRLWQGIPSIEHTDNGTTFVCFYSGEITETLGNYVLLYKSKDGVNFNTPIAIVLPEEGYRCFDPTLWIDPLGRLWWMWAQSPDRGTYGVICDDPDAENPTFGEPFYIGRDVMMCRPTILTTGEWLFPIAVWARFDTPDYPVPSGAYAYITNDCGKTFSARGFSKLDKRLFDEHMFVEFEHKVTVYVRTTYGIASADSYDGGKTWTGDNKFKIGPSSRFFIKLLPSGRLLMIYHDSPNSRTKLTAFLSEDGGKTWKYKLLLDERERVSYPDATIDKNGNIHIVYDRDRGCSKKSLAENQSCAREILTACITEEDIIAGSLISSDSYLTRVINKLGTYNGFKQNPYHEASRFTDSELSEYLLTKKQDAEIIDLMFEKLDIPCDKVHNVNTAKTDELITDFVNSGYTDKNILSEIISEIRKNRFTDRTHDPIIDAIIDKIDADISTEYSQSSIAERIGISKYYLAHLFKKHTGMTLIQFLTERRITIAKKLLRETTLPISDIASSCGYTPSYFSETFKSITGITPTEYRDYNKTH